MQVAEKAVAKVVGGEPVLSPPTTIDSFDPTWLSGHDIVYFRLHGFVGVQKWFGMDREWQLVPAVDASQLAEARMGGALVIVANCETLDSPMLDALFAGGAGMVIAGGGQNYAARDAVIGADKLAQWIIRGVKRGLSVEKALLMGKARLALTAWRPADLDAMAFRLVKGGVDAKFA